MAMAASASAQGLRDHHALAGRKPVGLDHDRRALRAHVGQCVGCIGETAIGAGRNVELAAEILGKSLGALELRRLLARAECLDAGRREIVDDPGRERRLRPDHDQINRVALAEVDHRRDGWRCRAPRIRLPARYRHCPARTRVLSAAGKPRSSTPERVRGRRNRAGGCSLGMQPNGGLPAIARRFSTAGAGRNNASDSCVDMCLGAATLAARPCGSAGKGRF